ncbi:MAG TPA: ABC transporter permease, partial [Candidatus Atribacteria bacterium]|nr:ABC transporter permease [Candidatus Atribacteria bacterium]
MNKMKIKRKKKNTFIAFLFIGIFLIVTLFPFFWMISTSFKIKGEFFTRPPIFIPDRFNFNAYRSALQSGGQKALIDSFVIALVSMSIALLLGTMGAYGLRELLKKGKNYGFWMLLIEMMPPISVVLPLFILFKYVHLLDTYPALILGNTVFVLPFAIWLLLGFLEDIPIPIEEAALIDGCSKFQVFSYIILPLLRSGLIPV